MYHSCSILDNEVFLIVLGSLLSVGSGILLNVFHRKGKLRFFMKYYGRSLLYVMTDDGIGGFKDTNELKEIRISIDLEISNSSLDFRILRDLKFFIYPEGSGRKELTVWDNEHSTGNGEEINTIKINPQDLVYRQLCFLIPANFIQASEMKLEFGYADHRGKTYTKKFQSIPVEFLKVE